MNRDSSGRRETTRRRLAGLVCWALATASLTAVATLTAEPAEARYATGGTGAYKGSIDWFEWGATTHELIPATGITKSNTRTVAGLTLATTCTLSNIVNGTTNAAAQLATYRSGVWGGDGMDDLYNIGGTGNNNQLIAGLWTGSKATFHVDCSVTLDGVPVPLAGLVMADAEQSLSYEYVEATPPAGSDWRMIDRIRSAGCTQGGTVTRTGQTLRLSGSAATCGVGPAGIAFMEGATSADMVIQGGGASALALGVMLFTDFGDAPASYGDAGALYSPSFAGTAVPEGANPIFGVSLNTPAQPSLRLGATVDSEGASQNTANASGDGSDEDAISPPGSVTVTPGSTYTLPNVACSGTGSVAGWIDWNKNGTFDAGERSAAQACAGSSVGLTWNVPNFVADGSSYLRLRIGADNAAVASPTGVSTTGEVEDYAITVLPRADFGDAPDTTGTTRAADGARHLVPGYDDVTHTAPVMLGAHVDIEDDGQASPAADADDLATSDDEDGVTFNPALGYPNPTIVSGTNAITLAAPVNHVTVNASAPGFASVWVDWNGDGDFLDAGERVADATAVSAGDNDLTFSSETNPNDIRTFVRVRYSTDAASIHTPTGAAPDGEVEDYRVLVERQIVPAACAPVTQPFYAMTFRSIKELTTGSGTQLGARYPEVTLIGGRPVDMLIQFVSGHAIRGFSQAGDDAGWQLNSSGGAAQITYTFVESGTTTPIAVNGVWTFNDMDAGELAQIQKDALAGYAVTPGSKVAVSQQAPYTYFAGTVGGNGAPESRFQIWFQGKSTFTSIWRGFANSGFFLDGDNDIPVPQSCDDYGDAPNSYGTLLASNGPHHHVIPELRLGNDAEFDGDGQPTAAANGDDTNRNDDEDGVSTPITITTGTPGTVTVNATNQMASDATLAGWMDLDHSGTFDPDERVVLPVPALTANGQYQLPFPAGSTRQPTYARFRLYPGTVADPSPLGAATAGEVEDYPVTVLTPKLTISKTYTAPLNSGPGDTVQYTVTLTNTGTGAYTAGNPARLVDDLTNVLDDATYSGDAVARVDGSPVASPTYADPRISWSGPLAVGKTVVVTYSVELGGGGNGQVRNTAFAPPTLTPSATPDCLSAAVTVPCATTLLELPKLTITKTANRTQLPSVGQTVTYTVTVTNAGPGDYTAAHPATFTDDLSAVLDDTLPPGAVVASRGTASFASPELSWTGALPAGESATITYTLTYTGAGDHQLVNHACVPADEAVDPTDDCRTVSIPGSGLRHHKSVNPGSGTPVDPGQVLTYTLTFENVGPTAATVDTADDLSGVLDDAALVGTPNAGAGLTATIAGDSLEIAGTVPAGETRTVSYQVQVRPFGVQADHLLANVLACEPGEPAGCAPETTSNPVRHLTLTKTSDATVEARPGDQVTYTITATNDGPGDWTALDPAKIVDDLAGVLDDATFDGSTTVSAGATSYAGSRLTWTGALAHGDTVTIAYTVTLAGGGDGNVDNVAWQPDPGPVGPTPDCATTALSCADERFGLPKLTIKKTSNRAQLPAAGQQIVYTVIVTNPGPGDYTAANPATFDDDLSDVLDDASFDVGSITASAGAADLAGQTLSWSGVLAAGESATVTYSLTYQDLPAANHVVDNRACIPVAEAADPEDSCRTVYTPGSGLRHAKRVNPRNGTPVSEGQQLTYTLTFENVGPADAVVDTFDDLAGVVDDATLDLASITADAGLTATPNGAGDRIAITGTVPTDQTLTVHYTVTVKPYAGQGDHVVTNALACEPGDPQPCDPTSTHNPVRHLALAKSSDGTSASRPGDLVTYTIRVTNDGAGDYTGLDPATVVDDLTDVVDDAIFTGAAHASTGPDPTYDAPRLTWSGPLAAGDTVRITYEVRLRGNGDYHVANTAWAPADPADPGPTPSCATATVPCDATSFDLPHVVPAKEADPATGTAVQPGDLVTFTLSWTNDGQAEGVVDSTDNLSGVLDDAVVVQEPTSSDSAVVAVRTGASLRVTGPIAVDATVTVTYQVRVKPFGQHGNNRLDNRLSADNPPMECDLNVCLAVPPPMTEHPVGDLDDWKTVDPASGSTVRPGTELTYTLHFANTGHGPVDVDRVDDLSGVLDDASIVSAPTASLPALSVTGPTAGTLSITGTLAAGASATVSYSVKVGADGERGDDRLGNFLLSPGDDTPASCTGDDPARLDCTVDYVGDVVVTKTSDVAPGDDVSSGDRVTYTLSFRNTSTDPSAPPVAVDQVDHLDDVLDDATWSSAPRTSSPELTATKHGSELHVAGALGSGKVVTVTYAVTANGDGDGRIRNVVGPAGEVAPPCAVDSPTCTLASVVDSPGLPDDPGQPGQPDQPSGLPDTGAAYPRWAVPAGILTVLLGLGLVLVERHRRPRAR